MAKRCLGCMGAYKEEFDVCPFCGYQNGSAPEAPYHLKPGTVVGNKYVIGKSLGYGGFGVTYVGYDLELQRKVAIKEYLPSEFATRTPGDKRLTLFSGDKEEQYKMGLKRFTDEAKRLAKFSSEEGIVREYDIVEENGTAYIVMEYLEGETLKERLVRENKLDEQESVRISVDILRALKKVHSQGIIHRDISPENVFLTKDNKVKLIDFGAARYATAENSKSLSVLLKPGYAPEEQYRSKGNQGPWSDVYAVGAVLYKMLTGKTPEDAMERCAKDKLKSPIATGAKISKNLNNAIMNALNIYKEDRTPSAEKFEKELLSAEEVTLKTQTILHPDAKGLTKWQKVTGVVLAAAIVVTGGILFLSRAQKPTQTIVRAPELLGMTMDEAQAEAEQYGIRISAQDKIVSSKVEPNLVLSQDPQPGGAIPMGQPVKLVISAGETQKPKPVAEGDVAVPDVQYKKEDEARQLLETAGFKVAVKNEESGNVAVGNVIRQDINNLAKTGAEITIYISTGMTYTVPNVVRLSKEDAVTQLQKLGVYGKTTEKNDSSALPGTVLSQSVEPGSKIIDGKTVVNIVVCKAAAAPTVTSPAPLASSVRASSTPPVSSTPQTSSTPQVSSVPKTSSTPPVSSIPQVPTTVSVPPLIGKSMNDAISALTNVGLTYNITEAYSDSVQKGIVISQSIPSGTKVENGATVTFTVSKGTSVWSDYVDTLPAGVTSENCQIEGPLTMYQYRDKTTTSSTSSSLSGWTLDTSKPATSSWSNWSSWSTTKYTKSEMRNVNTRNITDTPAKTQYTYDYWRYWNSDVNKYLYTYHGDYGGEYKKYTSDKQFNYYNTYDGNKSFTAPDHYIYYSTEIWFHETITTVPAVTHDEWQYQDLIFTYYFYKWSDWSKWSFDVATKSDTREVNTKTVYRYREK